MNSCSKNIAQNLMRFRMLMVKHSLLIKTLVRNAQNPDKTQEGVLRGILEKNQKTVFGKKYNFASISSSKQFIEQVPIHGYEELRPYMEKQIATGEFCIVPEKPVMYAQTSGTTSKPKYIPVLNSTIDSYKRAQRISSYSQYSAVPDIFAGKILAIVSPAIEGNLNDGTPYGSMSGLVYQNMPSIILSKYVLPPEVFEIADYESKYRLIAAFAMAEENITCLATANPSTLLRIIEIIHNHFEPLLEFIATGNLDILGLNLDRKLKEQIAQYCTANPKRAKLLGTLKNNKNELNFCDIWRNVKAVVTWTSGNCVLLLPKLKKQLLPETKIIEMGYLSSEFRGTITIDCESNLGIPTIQDNFFEFAEVDNWDAGNQETLLLSQLEMGKKYYIIVTTPHGLYRYFINDIIEVTGRFQNTPTIAFVQKGKGITNLTGEKLYESQVIQAVQFAANSIDIEPEFFMMLADSRDFSYTLYLETKNAFDVVNFTEMLNNTLSELNLEYLAKTQSGRIKFAEIRRLKIGTLEAYKNSCIKAGQREGQFKVVKLQYRDDILFPFEEYVAL